MPDTVRRRYEAMARSGEIVPDALQARLVDELDAVGASIAEIAGPQRVRSLGCDHSRGGRPKPRGLYIFGAVGRGKTLLMDVFFEAADTIRKRRVHFLPFMLEVQEGISAHRRAPKNGGSNGRDPIAAAADEIASKIELLCFDEFAVYDIADAMILGRLFEQLFARGVMIVATSNVAPDDLYKDGLNRALFLPFIALLKERMTIFHLDGAARLSPERNRQRTPLCDAAWPAGGSRADHPFPPAFRREDRKAGGDREQRPAGRGARGGRRVGKFAFEDLCSQAARVGRLSRIADAFHTIILADVPVLTQAHRNEAKRLIKLIDTLYDKEHPPRRFGGGGAARSLKGTEGAEAFEFQRTASRLIEMRSDAYWSAATAKAEKKKARADAPGPLE